MLCVFIQVSLLVVVEIGVFPLICGWWLDICSLVSGFQYKDYCVFCFKYVMLQKSGPADRQYETLRIILIFKNVNC